MMLSAFLVDACCRHLTRRTIYLLCFSLCTVSIALLESAFGSLWLLALLRLGLGLGMGIAIILGESWVNELCPEHNRGKIMALYATSFTGFQVLGPAMLAVLGADSPWITGVVTVCYGLALLCIVLTVPNDHVEHEEGEKASAWPGSSVWHRRCAWRCCSSRSSMPWCCRCCRCTPPAMALPLAWRR